MKFYKFLLIVFCVFLPGVYADEASIQFIRIIDSEIGKSAASHYAMRFHGLIPYKTYVLTYSGSIQGNDTEKEILRFQMDPSGIYQCDGKTYKSVGVENCHALVSERLTYKLFDLSGNLVAENSLIPNPISTVSKNATFTVSVEFLTAFQFILHWEGIKDNEAVKILYEYGLEKGATTVIPSQSVPTFAPDKMEIVGLPMHLTIQRSNGDSVELEFQFGPQMPNNFKVNR